MAFKLTGNQEQEEGGQGDSLGMLDFQASLKMLKFHEDAVVLHERWTVDALSCAIL